MQFLTKHLTNDYVDCWFAVKTCEWIPTKIRDPPLLLPYMPAEASKQTNKQENKQTSKQVKSETKVYFQLKHET